MRALVVRACALLACAALFCTVGCEKKKPPAVGQLCKFEDEGKTICADATKALVCDASRLVPIACLGPGGCSEKNAIVCDATVGREGEPCAARGQYESSILCSEDKKKRLECRAGRFVVHSLCRGPKGCDRANTNVLTSCNRAIAQVGDPCNMHEHDADDRRACSVDGKLVLACSASDKGVFEVASICTGPTGCTVGGLGGDLSIPIPVCDRSVATLGAACGAHDRSFRSCTPDGSSVLRCDGSTYVLEKACGPKERCVSPDVKNAQGRESACVVR